jgi:hypothetical protein
MHYSFVSLVVISLVFYLFLVLESFESYTNFCPIQLVITLSFLGSLALSFDFSKPLDFFCNFGLSLNCVIYLDDFDKYRFKSWLKILS